MMLHHLPLRNRRAWRRLVSVFSILGLLLPSIAFPAPTRATSAPTVTAPASITMNEGGIISFMVRAADADGDTITSFTASPLPPGASFSTGAPHLSGMFQWAPSFNQAGVYDVVFTATSGTPALTGTVTTHIVITDLDRAPVVTAPAARNIVENNLLSFSVTANDPDGNVITSLTASPLPPGATFTPNAQNTSGTFNWTPAFGQAGNYLVTFAASNTLSNSAQTSVAVTLGENHAPVFDTIPPTTMQARTTLHLPFTVRDQDSDFMTVGVSPTPYDPDVHRVIALHPVYDDVGLYQGELWFTPDEVDYGNDFTFELCASDGIETTCTDVVITVLNNHPPVIYTIPDITIHWGESVAQNFIATDQDLDDLTVRVVNNDPSNPATIFAFPNIIGTYSGQLRWTPTDPRLNHFAPQVCVSDGRDETCQTVSITVLVPSVQKPVVMVDVSPTEVCTGDPVTFDLTGSYDPDGSLTHGLGHFGDGEGWGSAVFPGWLYFTHAYATAGLYTSNFFVFDDFPVSPNGSDIVDGATVTVQDPVRPPAPSPLPTYKYGLPLVDPDTGLPNTGAGLTLAFTSVDGNFDPSAVDQTLANITLTYIDLEGRPHSIHPASAIVTASGIEFFFNPDDLEIMFARSPLKYFMTNDVVLEGKISGRDCGRIVMNAQVIVERINLAPVLATIGPKSGTDGNELRFTAKATDKNFDTLTYSGTGYPFTTPPAGPNRAILNASTGVFAWTPRVEDIGNHQATVCASDGSLQDCETFTITIQPHPVVPPIADFTLGPTCVGQPITFVGTTSHDPDGQLVNQAWNFDDGQTDSSGLTVTHTYDTAGSYTPSLVVTDNDGATDTESKSINVAGPVIGIDTNSDFALFIRILFAIFHTPIETFIDHMASYNPLIDPSEPESGYTEHTNDLFMFFFNPEATTDLIHLSTNLSDTTLRFTDGHGELQSIHPTGTSVELLDPAQSDSALAYFAFDNGTMMAMLGTFPNHVTTVSAELESRLVGVPGCDRVVGHVTITFVRNGPPTMDTISNQSLYRGDTAQITLNVADPDNDDLDVRYVNRGNTDLANATFDPVTRTFIWQPGASAFGPYTLQFCAYDPYSLRACQTTTVTVLNHDPVASAIASAPACVGRPVTLDGSASSDEDGTITSHTWDLDDGSVPISSALKLTHTYALPGTYHPRLDIKDNNNASASTTLDVPVATAYTSPASFEWAAWDGAGKWDATKSAIYIPDPYQDTYFPSPGNEACFHGGCLHFSVKVPSGWGTSLDKVSPVLHFNNPDGTTSTISGRVVGNPWVQAGTGDLKFSVNFANADLEKLFASILTDSTNMIVTTSGEIRMNGGSGCNFLSFDWTFRLVKNHPPVISPMPDQTMKIGDTLKLKFSASDPELDKVYMYMIHQNTLFTFPNLSSFGAMGGGKLTIVAGPNSLGRQEIEVCAFDEHDQFMRVYPSCLTFVVNVTN